MGDLAALACDTHRRIVEFLTWQDNSRLSCCCLYFQQALLSARFPLWWRQAQVISNSADDIVASFRKATKVSSLGPYRKDLSNVINAEDRYFLIITDICNPVTTESWDLQPWGRYCRTFVERTCCQSWSIYMTSSIDLSKHISLFGTFVVKLCIPRKKGLFGYGTVVEHHTSLIQGFLFQLYHHATKKALAYFPMVCQSLIAYRSRWQFRGWI